MCCRSRVVSRVGVLVGSLAASACGLGEESTILYLFATHHATPEDGSIPDRGADDQPRVFVNDAGWTITLVEGYIVTTQAAVIDCDDSTHALEMFWGPYAEDIRTEDLATYSVAGRELDAGTFCVLRIGYGPYRHAQAVGRGGAGDAPEDIDAVEGLTVRLRGEARRGDERVVFDHGSADEIVVDLDLSEQPGLAAPLVIGESEPFPKELTVAKTYDQIFSGVDFASYDPEAFDAELIGLLEIVTHGYAGQVEPVESPPSE